MTSVRAAECVSPHDIYLTLCVRSVVSSVGTDVSNKNHVILREEADWGGRGGGRETGREGERGGGVSE